MTSEDLKTMPSIQIDGITSRRALSLSNGSLGRVFRALIQAVYCGKTKNFDLEGDEIVYFQILYDYAIYKANAWYRKTSNFRNNNPRKPTPKPNE